jgi:hypothetical protein
MESFSFEHPDENSTAAAAEILGQMPEVQQHAIDQHESLQQLQEENAEKDSNGTPFDATIHTGSKLKDGTWRKRKNPQANASPSYVANSRKKQAETNTQETATALDTNAEAMACGAAIAATFLGACHMIGGEEWEPSKEEVAYQTQAWQQYCVAKQFKDFPPGLALSIAMMAYVGPRLRMPKTAEKVGKAKSWISLRVVKWKIKRELKKRGISAVVTIGKSGDGRNEILINGVPADETLKK